MAFIQVKYPNGNNDFWFGEELGPFLVETDAQGRVLRGEVHLPKVVLPGSTSTGAEVMAPQNPFLGTLTPNLNGSNGFKKILIADLTGVLWIPTATATATTTTITVTTTGDTRSRQR